MPERDDLKAKPAAPKLPADLSRLVDAYVSARDASARNWSSRSGSFEQQAARVRQSDQDANEADKAWHEIVAACEKHGIQPSVASGEAQRRIEALRRSR